MSTDIYNSKRKKLFRVQKEPASKDMHATRSEQTRAGLGRARMAGRVGGRRTVYPDEVIREAIRRHDSGETWAAAAAAVGISLDWLYARVRRLRLEDANAKAG